MAKYMTEYIDKEKAIYMVEKAVSKADAMMALLRMDPADVVPVRHGAWERHFSRPNVYADLYWHCSACGGKKADSWADKFKYCPDCGARMDGEQDG